MTPPLAELKNRLHEVYDLNMAAALLRWDQTTYMPPGGLTARGRQIALVSRIAHESSPIPKLSRLLDAAERLASRAPRTTPMTPA